jgi:hypothetical protein
MKDGANVPDDVDPFLEPWRECRLWSPTEAETAVDVFDCVRVCARGVGELGAGEEGVKRADFGRFVLVAAACGDWPGRVKGLLRRENEPLALKDIFVVDHQRNIGGKVVESGLADFECMWEMDPL